MVMTPLPKKMALTLTNKGGVGPTLMGEISRGKQFSTFSNDSYKGNSTLRELSFDKKKQQGP